MVSYLLQSVFDLNAMVGKVHRVAECGRTCTSQTVPQFLLGLFERVPLLLWIVLVLMLKHLHAFLCTHLEKLCVWFSETQPDSEAPCISDGVHPSLVPSREI